MKDEFLSLKFVHCYVIMITSSRKTRRIVLTRSGRDCPGLASGVKTTDIDFMEK